MLARVQVDSVHHVAMWATEADSRYDSSRGRDQEDLHGDQVLLGSDLVCLAAQRTRC